MRKKTLERFRKLENQVKTIEEQGEKLVELELLLVEAGVLSPIREHRGFIRKRDSLGINLTDRLQALENKLNFKWVEEKATTKPAHYAKK